MREHPRAAAVPYAVKQKIIARQSGLCFYCQCPSQTFVMDHLLPRSLGGPHDESNRVAACRPCDAEKAARPPTEAELARQALLRARVQG